MNATKPKPVYQAFNILKDSSQELYDYGLKWIDFEWLVFEDLSKLAKTLVILGSVSDHALHDRLDEDIKVGIPYIYREGVYVCTFNGIDYDFTKIGEIPTGTAIEVHYRWDRIEPENVEEFDEDDCDYKQIRIKTIKA